ncbi:nucleoside hydrolase [Cellulomonas sp. SLBN-39]|uniref:nucleoside hydrolase n=1 Tax=Cellulomonas sp. SLBN-39 TaxID=2768446 RepID=UPI0011515791|nr:nucleoside hydrolase [Cellulomonas sp. SLBN-39]TQL01838.1 purine nucleosidase [Cellulomonas sp. SLBN-39]
MRIPLVVDTDTAADDCFALLVALLDPRADLRAITMVAGNVGFDQQVENAFLTLEVAGRPGEVPVHLGARTPLVRPWVSAEDVHGDGVGGQRRTGTHAPADEHAVDALVRLAAEHAGRLTVVAIGPLTNIALAVRRDPAFAANVAELVIMGGSINGAGNVTPAAEYNVYVDPEAADVVLRAGFARVRMVTWDPVTLQGTVFGPERIAQIDALGTTLSRFFVRANQATYDFDVADGIPGSTHPDSLSVLLALDDSYVIDEGDYAVAVELRGEHTAGATVFDARAAHRPVRAPRAIDGDRFFAYVRDLLATR